jgi:hypothetical protein
VEHFHDAIPDRLPIEYFFHWNAFTVRSLSTVEFMNRGPEFVDVTHAKHGISSFNFKLRPAI